MIKPIEVYRSIAAGLRERPAEAYEPTGLIEPMIKHFGEGEAQIICVIMANKCGKTAGWVNVLKGVIWPTDNPFFNYQNFKHWPYRRKVRVATTIENAKEAGPIREEILRWWPNGRYTEDKAGRHHVSLYTTDTGWKVEVLTSSQAQIEFEGPGLGVWVMDEPAKPWMIGAMNRGLERGGVGIIVFTPVSLEGGYHPGPIIDTIEDLAAKGARVSYVGGTIWENDIETGKPNSRGTKRGFLTSKQITDYVNLMPASEREAREQGKFSFKSGRVYPGFAKEVHVCNYDLYSDYIKKANVYMAADFHRKYYPCFLWIARPDNDRHIVINEWPTYDTFNGYYDERRTSEICHLTYEQLAEIMKLMDQARAGVPVIKRWIDPLFAKGTENEFAGDRKTLGVVDEFAKHNIFFKLPPVQQIAQQRMVIEKLLWYDKLMPPSIINAPNLLINANCRNMIRCLERHYWLEGKEVEAEDYKDFIDLLRYYLAGLGGVGYIDQTAKPKAKASARPGGSFEQYKEILNDVRLD